MLQPVAVCGSEKGAIAEMDIKQLGWLYGRGKY
jgi:hypothetical protein